MADTDGVQPVPETVRMIEHFSERDCLRRPAGSAMFAANGTVRLTRENVRPPVALPKAFQLHRASCPALRALFQCDLGGLTTRLQDRQGGPRRKKKIDVAGHRRHFGKRISRNRETITHRRVHFESKSFNSAMAAP